MSSNPSLHLFKKYAAVSTTHGTFDQMGDYNAQMDITEFTRFAKDFGLTDVLTIAKLKMIFQNANTGDAADDRRGYLNADEFSFAVNTAVERAKAEFERRGKEVNNGVRALEAELRAKPAASPRSPRKSPKAKAAPKQEIVSAEQELAIDVQGENPQSDVRVPVSKLWCAIREVESHMQTEDQLRATIDRLTMQYKEELGEVTRQKDMAVAALERSENELLEYEVAAMAQVKDLNEQLDQAEADRKQAEDTCDAMRAEREETFKAMRELTRACELKVKAAQESEAEMSKLLHGGNVERDEAYEDGRRMAQLRVEQQKRQEENEASLKAEIAALQRAMEDKIAQMLREREQADAEAAATIKQVRSECREEIDSEIKRNQQHLEEIQATHDAAMAAQKADYEAQLLAAGERYKALADRMAEACAAHEKAFSEAEEERKASLLKLEGEMSDLKNQLAETSAELARTKDAKAEAEERLSGEIDRLYDQLKEEREKREAITLRLAEVEQESLEKRQQMQAEIDEMLDRALAAESKLADGKQAMGKLEAELADTKAELAQANTTISELEALVDQLKGLLEESKQREAVVQDKLEGKTREMEESVEKFTAVVRENEQTIATTKADLQQSETENGSLREENAKLREELTRQVSRLEEECETARATIQELRELLATREEEYENNLAGARADYERELEDQKDQYETRLAELKEQYEARLETEKSEYEAQLAREREQHAAELAEVQRVSDDLESAVVQQLQCSKTSVKHAEKRVRNLSSDKDSADAEIASLQKSFEQLDAHCTAQQREIESLKTMLSAAEDENKQLRQALKEAEDSARRKAMEHDTALDSLRSDHLDAMRELEQEHQREKDGLNSKIHDLQGELAVLQALHRSAKVSIEELEGRLEQLRAELREESAAHESSREALEVSEAGRKEALRTTAQLELDLDELRLRNEQQASQILQLEADKRLLELNKNELTVERDQLQFENDQLKSRLVDLTAQCDALQKRNTELSQELTDKMVEIDTLTVEVRTLEETNAEIAAETQKAIAAMTDEMEKMRQQFQAQLAKLEAELRRVCMDRDELESAYQFAKDELQVIRTTLNSMEEGSKSVRYITEQPGNPTLVNRMNSEWGRVANVGPSDGGLSPRSRQSSTTAFSRDFRAAQRNPTAKRNPDAPKQGDIGGSWRY